MVAASSASLAIESTNSRLSFLALLLTSLSLVLYEVLSCSCILHDLELKIFCLRSLQSSIFFHVSSDSHSLFFLVWYPKVSLAVSRYISFMISYWFCILSFSKFSRTLNRLRRARLNDLLAVGMFSLDISNLFLMFSCFGVSLSFSCITARIR